MHRFKWTKAHAVYVPEVDAEHRNLFRLADELEQIALRGSGTAHVLDAARALIAAVEDHFTHEERMMRTVEYPAFAWHKAQHDTARKRARQMLPRIENGDGQAVPLLLEFLLGWLKDHTGLTDRMFGAYLRNHERLTAAAAS